MKIHHLFKIMIYASGLLAPAVWAAQSAAEIRVNLATESLLHPIYVSRLSTQNAPFDPAYVRALETILSYDLNFNAKTKVIAPSSEKEQILNDEKPSAAFNPGTWKNHGVHYVLKWHISHKTIQATLLNVHNGSIKAYSDIALTGDLNQDRRQVHKLADGIYKALFNANGIAHSFRLSSEKSALRRQGMAL
jgi:TolB protein